jgi:hypothetical protein
MEASHSHPKGTYEDSFKEQAFTWLSCLWSLKGLFVIAFYRASYSFVVVLLSSCPGVIALFTARLSFIPGT